LSYSQADRAVLNEYVRRKGHGGIALPPQLGDPAVPYIDWLSSTSPPGWDYTSAHIKFLAKLCQKILDGDIDRSLVCLPPRHAKTETVTVRLAVRALMLSPNDWFLVTAYNERFARRLGRKMRNLAIASGLPVAPGKHASDEWELSGYSGGIMARGVGSPPTGVGFKGILIDDPIRRREDAESEVYREKVWDWFTDDLMTRLEPAGWLAIVMTLWHHDDIGARSVASEPGKYFVAKLRAIAEADDPLGRQAGEALWPARYPLDSLERIRATMTREDGEYGWQALYQQNPTAKVGMFFDVSKIEIVDAVPVNLRSCRAWDIAASRGKGDSSAGCKMEGPDKEGVWYMTDCESGQWDSAERDRRMRMTAEFDGRGVRVRVPQDPGAAGKSLAENFVRLLAGFTVVSALVSGDKETRASPLASQVNAGNVKMLRGEWNRRATEIMRQFPLGKHDDEVDGFADAFNDLAGAKVAAMWSIKL